MDGEDQASEEIGPLDEAELDRFVDELWLPFNRETTRDSVYTLRDDIRADGIDHRRDRLSRDDTITYLARRADRLLGFVTAEVQTPPPIFEPLRECHVNEVFVREADRREGVGGALLSAVEAWGARRDCELLDLNVLTASAGARALYEAHGYDVERFNLKKRIDGDRDSC